jgi:hypothetical protein
MKKIWIFAAIVLLALSSAAGEKKPLRVLMIGNSFSLSVMKELPKIVDAQDEYALDITSMYIGGCSLERHIAEYEKAKQDPSHRPYGIDRYITGKGKLDRVKGNLIEMLDAPAYDIVTIQQASPKSFDPAGWEPYGDQLVALVRAKHPQAKLLLHQTWSYRPGAPKLLEWKIDQREMFERVKKVYDERAKHFGAGIIPMGEAVRIYRDHQPPTELPKLSKAELDKFKYPKRPPFRGDVAGSYRWSKSRKTGKMVLNRDTTHLNPVGEYLQGCVWFGALFGADVNKITYCSKYLKPEEAALLRRCAAEALAGTR